MATNLSEKFLEKDGCEIHYWVSDDAYGPWLIFLHGAGVDHRMFDAQIPVLDDGFRVLLWDARGHGLSKPLGNHFNFKLLISDLLEIMNIEEIDKATFIGQSMGGNIAQEMAFFYPERVENLVLIDCTCNTMKLSFLDKFGLEITPFLLSLYPWGSLAKSSAKASSVSKEIQKYLLETVRNMGKKDFIKIFSELRTSIHYEDGYKINKNILFVCGEKDNTGNIKKIAPIWAAQEPSCRFHFIKNAGHCANQDNPADFNTLLLAFLNEQYSNSVI